MVTDQSKSVPAEYLDHTNQAYANDSSERFRAIRQQCPVAHSDKYGGFWVLSDYADIIEATRNTQLFSSAKGVTIPHIEAGVPVVPLQADPPIHAHYRRLLQREFARGQMAQIEGFVRALANELIDTFADRGSADLVAELASPLPAIVIAQMMGFPREDWVMFRDRLDVIVQSSVTGDVEAGGAAAIAFMSHLAETLADRRDNPRDDMLTRIATSVIDDRPITDEEALGSTWTTVVAGHETTVGGIGALLLHVAKDDSFQTRIRSDPSLVASAVEETVRLEAPIQGMRRSLTGDVCIQGTQLRAGDDVWLSYAAANRDETRFPLPDAFIPDRSPNRHLGFGDGIHRCVGAPLAQLEMQVVLEEVLRRIPTFALAEGAEPQYYATQSRKLLNLPVTW